DGPRTNRCWDKLPSSFAHPSHVPRSELAECARQRAPIRRPLPDVVYFGTRCANNGSGNSRIEHRNTPSDEILVARRGELLTPNVPNGASPSHADSECVETNTFT